MLDAPDPDFRDVLAAVERWRPDPQCLAAGDEYARLGELRLAVQCWATLTDRQIIERIVDLLDGGYHYSAIALARHCAAMDMPLNHIIAVLAYLAAEVPCWPGAADLAEIAIAAVKECAA